MKPGTIAILNCTDGDTRITFNSRDEGEVERAKAVVSDMLRRGYCIAVDVGGRMERVTEFDETKNEYVVTDHAPKAEGEATQPKERGRRRVPAKTTKAYAVGPTAGGGLGVRAFGFDRAELQRWSSR